MPISNLDNKKTMETLRAELFASLQSGDEKQAQESFSNFAEGLQREIIADAKKQVNETLSSENDATILINRGIIKPLTQEEMRYFNEAIVRGGFENIDVAFPTTIIDEVFKNLKNEHGVLSSIDMQNTSVLAKYIFAKPTTSTAFWGQICEDIKQMILSGIDVIDVRSSRLSGFVPVCKGMLELGPVWLARYVITIITEIMATGLENAIIGGTGKQQPIGMIKKLSGAVDSVYPDKAKIALKDLSAKSLGGIRAAMAQAKTDTANVCILVNPTTYWAKIFPGLAYHTVNGSWVLDVLPSGERIIKSYAVPQDVLIFGDPKNYFLGVASDVTITKYTETLAIEDMDLFIAKFYGYGMPKDQNAFFVADVSTMDGGTVPALEKYAANSGDNTNSMITKDSRTPGV